MNEHENDFWVGYSGSKDGSYLYLRRKQATFELIGDAICGRCLDVGCGNSSFTKELFRRGLDEYVGLDINKNTLINNKAKFNDEVFENTSYMMANSNEIPLKNEMFDYVFCFEVLEHLPMPEFTLLEMSRVLKKNGTLIISVPTLPIERIVLTYILDKLKIFEDKIYISLDHKREYSAIKLIDRIDQISNLKKQMHQNGFEIIGEKSCWALYNHLAFYLPMFRNPMNWPMSSKVITSIDKIVSEAILKNKFGQYLVIRSRKRL